MPHVALTPNTVELIPTLGAPSPRGGPVQDPVLTPRALQKASANDPTTSLQGDLAHKKQPPFRTIQQAYAYGPMVVLGVEGGSYERGTPVRQGPYGQPSPGAALEKDLH